MNGHSPLIDVTPLDEHGGLSCMDASTGLRLNLRQVDGHGLEQVFGQQFGGSVAAAQIHEILTQAMEEVGAVLHEHGIHAVRFPPGLERDM